MHLQKPRRNGRDAFPLPDAAILEETQKASETESIIDML